MKKLIYIFMMITLISTVGLPAIASASDQSAPVMNSKASILIDGKTGQVIYEQNPDLRLYPASTTKIITAILAIENGKMDQQMTASRAAVNEIGLNGSNVGIVADETLLMEDLLNALLIKSANDTANIIAENISPTRNEFVDLMNKRARELGATNTTFTNTCGLDKSDGHPNHLTTVSDMSKIAKYAMTLPIFREIVSKQKYTMHDTNKHPSSYWPKDYVSTTNKFMLGFNKYKNENFEYTGIKTGYTNLAGCNLIAAAKNKDGMELIAVVYGYKDQESLYADTKKLFEYGFDTYGVKTLVTTGQVATTIPIANSEKAGETLEALYDKSLQTVLPKDYDVSGLTRDIKILDGLTAPVSQGDVIGNVEFRKNDLLLGTTNLVAASNIAAAPAVPFLQKSAPHFYSLKNIIVALLSSLLLLVGYRYYVKKPLLKLRSKRRSEN